MREIRSKSSVFFDDFEASRRHASSTAMVDNPMHTRGTRMLDTPGALRSDALPEPELQHQNNTTRDTAEPPLGASADQFTRSMCDRNSSVTSRPRDTSSVTL